MLRAVTEQQPPPVPAAQPGQAIAGDTTAWTGYGPPDGPPQPGPPLSPPPRFPASLGAPAASGHQDPPGHYTAPPLWQPPHRPAAYGTNGFAIVALVCALTGLFPVAVVFGVLALGQLRRRPQRGRGMAIAGLLLGSLGMVLLAAVVLALIISTPVRDSSGRVTWAGGQSIDSLKVGDCFDGLERGGLTAAVTVMPCGTPHEAEVGAVVTLPDTEFPGADEAAAVTEERCAGLDSIIDPDHYEDVELHYLYPDSASAWETDRTSICLVIGVDGRKLTGSVLQTTDSA